MVAQTPDITTNPMASAQTALTYGPQTQQALRRSQYLADALRQTTDLSQPIRGGWGELGARLLATAVMQHANDKGQDALIKAMSADQQDETSRMLAGLTPPQTGAPPAMPSGPPPAAQPDPATSSPPPAPTSAPGLSDADKLALARTVWGEARGEPVSGQRAVASVILNRSKASGKSPSDIVSAPHQFAGYNPQSQAVAPDQLQSIMANIAPALAGQDPTGGADHFFNPTLAHPSWGQGDGQMIGQQKFMHLGDQGHQPPLPPGVQMTGGPPPQGQMQVAPSMAAAQQPPAQQPAPQPYQVAANGQTPPPPQSPSAPGSSPPGAGAPPAAPLPQAQSAVGGNAWPNWAPSQQEYHYVQGLLVDSRTHAQGVQAAMQMRQKMTQPVEATVQMINGVPFYVPKDPTAGAPTVAIPVPREAMTQHQDGASAGLPSGAQMDVSPTGSRNVVYKPPEGYEAAPGSGLHYQQGGPADPARPQTPAQGYQYTGAPNQQQAIQGGPADPKSPQNLLQGTQSIQKEIRPLVDLAVVARQSYGAVQTGFQQQNGAGDIAMVNGLQHLIDKGVVRGEDVNMQMKSNGLTGSVGSLTQYLQSGGLLTPEIRQRVLKTATDLFGNVDKTYRAQVMGYRQTVDNAYGQGSFDQYVMPAETVKVLGWDAPPGGSPQGQAPAPAAAPTFQAGTQDAALAEAVRRRLPLNPAQSARAQQLGLH